MELHPYIQAEMHSEYIFGIYDKFVDEKGMVGGKKEFKDTHNKQIYDFVKIGDNLFIGHPKNACMTINVENKEAMIMWFGHIKNCAHWRNAKHMFLWGLVVLLREFPKIKKISLGDDTKIKCKNSIHRLAKYYFLRYGAMYYELYFDFKIYFQLKQDKKQYEEALYKRKKTKITKIWVKDFLLEINENPPIFIDVFGNNLEMPIEEYLSCFKQDLRKEYCDIFYLLTSSFFNSFISISLPSTFYINIDKKSKFVKYLKEKINKIIT